MRAKKKAGNRSGSEAKMQSSSVQVKMIRLIKDLATP